MNWDRIEKARNRGRLLLGIPILLIVLHVFGWTSAPRFIGGMYEGPRVAGVLVSDLLTVAGVVGVVVGFVWMWRIYRAPTKVKAPLWRYRDR
jgi:hypothetical protein